MASVSKVPVRTLLRWVGLAIVLAVLLLGLTLAAAAVLPSRDGPVAPAPPYATGDAADVLMFAARNGLVAALVTALALMWTRPAAPDDARGATSRRRLAGAAVVALVAVQAYRQGSALAWISFYLEEPAWRLLLAGFPHAVLELTAILLPVAAAVLATRAPLPGLDLPSVKTALAVALPLLLVAAVLETYVSPQVFEATACTQADPQLTAQGGCKPCPPWAEAAITKAYAAHERAPEAAYRLVQEGCIVSPGVHWGPPPGFE